MPLLAALDRSPAADSLKTEIRALLAQPFGPARSGSALRCARSMPAVKVERVLTMLFSELPDLPIEALEIDARAGCSDFTGHVAVTALGTTRVFEFVWDCRWRAAEEGMLDHWGEPDQIRAAREFGWRCFAHWAERGGQEQLPRSSREGRAVS
ncbi:MAG: hypothetical protein HOQ11_04275 [Gemmatimonadaceae bacterium]|nr:hypothetical protein [Gemmatimonadaceae bacterium]NUQ93093.1 hypothetical protein [Gemmatimonadaceae bacterium]NUR21177.1 hypothetical protein [Gemmatimonadaceae bacterium]NUS96607.1 hypothetical protein [Gemmatimonadaceae bacterium]